MAKSLDEEIEPEVPSKLGQIEDLKESDKNSLLWQIVNNPAAPKGRTNKQPTPEDPFADYNFGDD